MNYSELRDTFYTLPNGKTIAGYFYGVEQLNSHNGISVGDTVTHSGTVDHKGKIHPPIHDLIVRRIERHASKYGCHYRIYAQWGMSGHVEGNANSFELPA